jgi:hypothetical protein
MRNFTANGEGSKLGHKSPNGYELRACRHAGGRGLAVSPAGDPFADRPNEGRRTRLPMKLAVARVAEVVAARVEFNDEVVAARVEFKG